MWNKLAIKWPWLYTMLIFIWVKKSNSNKWIEVHTAMIWLLQVSHFGNVYQITWDAIWLWHQKFNVHFHQDTKQNHTISILLPENTMVQQPYIEMREMKFFLLNQYSNITSLFYFDMNYCLERELTMLFKAEQLIIKEHTGMQNWVPPVCPKPSIWGIISCTGLLLTSSTYARSWSIHWKNIVQCWNTNHLNAYNKKQALFKPVPIPCNSVHDFFLLPHV